MLTRSLRRRCRDHEKRWRDFCVDKNLEEDWLERLNSLKAFTLIGICEGHHNQRAGSATKTRISLGEEQAAGDLNGDGAKDAAVTLVADPGGSGTFTYLAAVINQEGVARPIASVFLGDRIVVKSLAIQSGEIVVTLLTRKPDEPMAAEPTVEVTRKFRLQGDELVEAE